MPILLAFMLWPLIEIALFVVVGGAIGVWPTLAIVIGTSILGSAVMRSQGRVAVTRLNASFAEFRDPAQPLADGAMVLMAGFLLFLPGFFTDALGLVLLVPGIRTGIFSFLRTRMNVQTFQAGGYPGHGRAGGMDGDVIEGEFTEVRPRDTNTPSGWVENKDGNRK